jgi:guanine deaminase
MEKTKEYFMSEAIRLAIENVKSGNGGPFGAIIVKDEEIIGRGVNTVTSGNDPTAHAEVNAIRDACEKIGNFQLIGCEIYTSCEPCPMCLGAIYWARPDKVFYAANKTDAAKVGFDDSFIYNEIGKDYSSRKIPFINIMRKDALQIFTDWINNPHKTEY